MIKEIIKRDGRKVPFNREKIAIAIFKAAQSLGGNNFEMSQELAQKVEARLNLTGRNNFTVEEVQDLVEIVLMEDGHAQTAKKYILYREQRSKMREMDSDIMKIFEDITFSDAKDSDIKRENANVNADTAMGTMLKYGSEGAKKFYKIFVLDPVHSAAHDSGDIHIHDLDFYTLTTTCCQIDLIELFKNGFSTGEGFLREPNDIQSYSALACIAIQSNQNDQHGGQSIPNFDYAMAQGVKKTYRKNHKRNLVKALELLTSIAEPNKFAEEIIEKINKEHNVYPTLDDSSSYLKYEKDLLLNNFDNIIVEKIQKFVVTYTTAETEKATYQAMEALIHNLNTMHSRAGAQVPFSSINYGLDLSSEGRMVMKQLLLATERGLGNGETPIFPIQIFRIKEGINYNVDEPNYDLFKLAMRVSAKRLFPNFSFIDAPYNLKYYKQGDYNSEIAYMGCRTRVIANVYAPDKEVVSGRGNLSFTSINLPRLGILAKGNMEVFYEMLNEKVDLCINQLLHRFRIQAKRKVRNYPFLMGQGVWQDSKNLKIDDEVGEILKHGTFSVGFIGLAECLTALKGSHHGETEESRKLGYEIISFIRNKLDEESQKTKLNFTLLATPAEGLSGRFVRLDRKRFGTLKGITDREYYTNSFHVPVYYKITAFEKINIEAPYHALTNAGHISYVEIDGNPSKNLSAFEKIVRHMKESGVGYGSINHPLDRDPVCGYTGVIGNKCPVCGREDGDDNIYFDRIRRITGYLVGTVDRFNNAKRAEEKDRIKHGIE